MLCSFLSQMGDNSVVFQILEKAILGLILLQQPLEIACAMLRVLIILDSKPTRLSEKSIIALSNFLPGYLMDVVLCIPVDDVQTWQYYLLPCFFMFDRSYKLLKLVLDVIGSFLTDNNFSLPSDASTRYAADSLSRINATISLLLLMYEDIKVHKIVSLFKEEISSILQSLASLQIWFLLDSEVKMTIEERHRFQCSFEQLKAVTSTSPAGCIQ
ncbi:uncharacterized protein LOC120159822 [Hibiscus syriacus]|uniref:uncharacterized protein LOC120159822 n=1 Tax=Hibiscus syriacus TaxID=106335 RepID=UPI0019210D66|nr:uncharacterized protein LOC120159822 [Hibiscus syriacus]